MKTSLTKIGLVMPPQLVGISGLRHLALALLVVGLSTAWIMPGPAQPAILNLEPGIYEVSAPFVPGPAFTAFPAQAAGVPDLAYSTFLGGSCEDRIYDMAMDSAGNIYVTGQTASVDFPTTPSAFDTSNNDHAPDCQINDHTGDAFVAKLSPDGELLYSTFLGGSGHDGGIGIAVDDAGNAYIAGLSWSTDFPTTPGALDTGLEGGRDAFVAKLSPDGSTLLYSTYLGGRSWDYGLCIAIDDTGSAYVGGFTHGSFPITSGAAQTTFGGSGDGFASKLSPDGGTLLYSTYLGGYSWESIDGIAVDDAGNAYLASHTHSTDFPTTPGAWDRTCDNCRTNFSTDGAVAKLNADGSEFVYSTLIGGADAPGGEEFRDIAIDSAGNAYLIGSTSSSDFPTTTNAPQPGFGGGDFDAVVVKLNADGSDLLYSTYLGGGDTDRGFGIAMDADGNAYVTGFTASTDFPTVDPLQAANVGGYDTFAAKLNADGDELLFSAYLGGSNPHSIGNEEYVGGIAPDGAGDIYLAASTSSADFPVTGDAVQPVFGGVRDGFMAKIATEVANIPPSVTAHQAMVTVDEGQTAINNGAVSDPDGDPVTLSASVGAVTDEGDGTWSWSFVTSDGPAESQTVAISADDGRGGMSHTTFDLTVNNVVPTTGEITAPMDPVQANTEIHASADFSDPGVLDTHAATWDWGDGSTSAGTVNETSGSGMVTGGHTYTNPGVYTVKLTVEDKDGDRGVSTHQFVVVYDPGIGFVTGGGWIDSPPGAYAPDPSLTGKASFGFVSKYTKGAYEPDGSTQFQLKAGDLNFHSNAYDWLVIANHTAQYKGTGTVNGAGNYGFMLTAIDADLFRSTDVDLFRIKIWDKDNGDAVVYDNQMRAGEDAKPTTAIGGGSIVIHQAKGNK
jgi:hypothetical protein